MRLVVIIIAFIGLALALEVQSVATLNWRGIMFAFLAAIGSNLAKMLPASGISSG
jgi:hypothetical protein